MLSHYADAEERRRTVLVVVLTNAVDFHRAAQEGWYRIPQRQAPRRIGADYLAFYQTGAFAGQPEAQTISFIAPTCRYQLMQRRQLLPDEADHCRADEYYYRIEIGALQRLERPVRAARFRRLTFVHTTLHRLLAANDVLDLFQAEDPFEQLWTALREHGLRPLGNRIVAERPVDIVLRARRGSLGIFCVAHYATQERCCASQVEPWEFLQLAPADIAGNLPGCLHQIGAALLHLGGSMLHLPPAAEG